MHSFSILIEAENLSSGPANLHACLESLVRQTVPLSRAERVVLIDRGDLGHDLRAELKRRYDWLTVTQVDPGTRYGGMKNRSSALAESEILLLADCDCRYPPDWLERILEPFADPDVQIVGGETTTPIRGPYSLAIALTFVFPRFSRDQALTPSATYWANNVAVRRTLLEILPVPDPACLYRGQNIVHSKGAVDLGVTIWRQPQARVQHALPTLSELPARYLRLGRDSVNIRRLSRWSGGGVYRGDMAPDMQTGGRLVKLLGRVRAVRSDDGARCLLYLPLAAPVLLLCAVFYHLGRWLAARQ